MGKLTKLHVVEAAVWLGIAAVAFIYSFKFDRPIEIYKFGATAWPRAIIVMMALAALGQFYRHWRHGDDFPEQAGGDEATGEAPRRVEERKVAYYLRIAPMLALPFLYAYLLEPIGFYSLTPFFVAAVIILMGERRPRLIIGVSLLIYAVLLLFFATLLYVGLPVGTLHPFYDFSNWLLTWIR